MEDESVTVGGENKGDIKDGSVIEALLHAVAYAMIVVLGFDNSDGDVGLVVEDAVGAFGLAACDHLTANDDSSFGEANLFANLGHLVPARLLYGGNDVLSADVALCERFFHYELSAF